MPKLLWTQKQDMGPQPRLGHAMAYDAARAAVVLFGGRSDAAGDLGDTWAWDGSHWTQVADLGPGPRSEHAIAYDIARKVVVLFGGRGNDVLGDTWQWDGDDWTQVADTGPSARSGHAMAYDAVRDRVVLFGGAPAAAQPAGDTWQWDGQEWTQYEDVGPPPRRDHVLAFDATRGRVVLFGGADAAGNAQPDTWEWDGAAWTQVAEFGPDPCVDAAMVFKSARVALYGGAPAFAQRPAPAAFRFTWEWDGKYWTARQDIGPGPRAGHSMAFDTARSRVVLFGGSAGPANVDAPAQPLGDTWEHIDGAMAPPTGQAVGVQSLRADPATTSMRNPVPISLTATLNGDAPASGLTIALEVAGDSVLGLSSPLPNFVVPAGTRTATTVIPGTLITSRVDFPIFRLRSDVTIRASGGGATTSAPLTLTFP